MSFCRYTKQSRTFFCCCITNSQHDQLPVGFIAKLVEQCPGIAEVMGSNPVCSYLSSVRNCYDFAVMPVTVSLCLTRIFISNHCYTARYTLRQRINLQWKYSSGYCTFFSLAVFTSPKLLSKMCKVSSRLCRTKWPIEAVLISVSVTLSDNRRVTTQH